MKAQKTPQNRRMSQLQVAVSGFLFGCAAYLGLHIYEPTLSSQVASYARKAVFQLLPSAQNNPKLRLPASHSLLNTQKIHWNHAVSQSNHSQSACHFGANERFEMEVLAGRSMTSRQALQQAVAARTSPTKALPSRSIANAPTAENRAF